MSKTTTVRTRFGRAQAYAQRETLHDGTQQIVVRVYDDVAQHYTVCHSLTAAQVRHVIGRTLGRAD